jgi:biotin carboxylase
MFVIFVCPIFSPAATQMIEAALTVPQVRLGVIAQQPLAALVPNVAARLAAHWQVDDVTNATSLEHAVRALGAAHGAIVRCFGAYEQLQQPLATVRERLGIPGLSSNAAHNFRDKARMKDALRAAGVPVARHRLITSRDDALAFIADVGYPVVLKPPAGAGAIATHRIRDVASLDAMLVNYPATAAQPMLAEEFLRGTEYSLETVSVDGHAMWHSLTRYGPTPLDVVENAWIQWTVLLPREVDAVEFDDIRAVGAKALAALGMGTGVSHCEWFRREDGTLAISEIAARPPGANITTMISRAHDIDFVAAWVHLMINGTFDPPERRYAVGTAYLRGQGTGQVRSVEGIEAIRQQFGAMICDARLPVPGQHPTGSYEGEGYIIVRHPETSVVEHALHCIVSSVRVRLG